MTKKPIISLITLIILGLAVIGERARIPTDDTLSWDVFGYYLYLPSFFIYDDLALEKMDVYKGLVDKYENTGSLYQITSNDQGDNVLRYPIGWALLYFPFFFIGHAVASFTAFPADGLSLPYQYAIGYGSLIFAIGGLYFFRKFLLNFFSDRITALLLVLVVLGTNYLHLTTKLSVLPHNHIFSLFAVLCWFTYKWHRSPKFYYAFFIGLCGGLMTVSRPSTILAFLVPLLWGISSWSDFKAKMESVFLTYRYHFLTLIMGVLVPGLFQMVYWKLYAGSWIFYSYQDPAVGLDLLAPHPFKFLFSFRGGWLIYTPLVMVFLVGFFFKSKQQHKGLLLPILIYLTFHLYITSSWTNWWYGADYSQRAMAETYVLLALPMGWLLEYLSNKRIWLQASIASLIIALVGINLFHRWQLYNDILYGSRMTMDYYFKVMGKTYVKDEWKEHLLVKRTVSGEDHMPDSLRDKGQEIAAINFENSNYKKDTSNQEPEKGVKTQFYMDSSIKYSKAITMPFHKITDSYYAWLSVHAQITPLEPIKDKPLFLVVHFEHEGRPYKYRVEQLTNANKGDPVTLAKDYLTPYPRSESDILKTYIWNREGHDVLINHLSVLKHNN